MRGYEDSGMTWDEIEQEKKTNKELDRLDMEQERKILNKQYESDDIEHKEKIDKARERIINRRMAAEITEETLADAYMVRKAIHLLLDALKTSNAECTEELQEDLEVMKIAGEKAENIISIVNGTKKAKEPQIIRTEEVNRNFWTGAMQRTENYELNKEKEEEREERSEQKEEAKKTEHFEMNNNESITKQEGDAIVRTILEEIDAQLEGPDEGEYVNNEEMEDPITPEKKTN